MNSIQHNPAKANRGAVFSGTVFSRLRQGRNRRNVRHILRRLNGADSASPCRYKGYAGRLTPLERTSQPGRRPPQTVGVSPFRPGRLLRVGMRVRRRGDHQAAAGQRLPPAHRHRRRRRHHLRAHAVQGRAEVGLQAGARPRRYRPDARAGEGVPLGRQPDGVAGGMELRPPAAGTEGSPSRQWHRREWGARESASAVSRGSATR